ncbi:hypothetical protein, partial [Pseudonocardia spinosispora]|uniref:hypothetical protein n=1 Tax=Pseudonocardia spinosispora TaxID=103441 RepID=UPI001B7FD83A
MLSGLPGLVRGRLAVLGEGLAELVGQFVECVADLGGGLLAGDVADDAGGEVGEAVVRVAQVRRGSLWGLAVGSGVAADQCEQLL